MDKRSAVLLLLCLPSLASATHMTGGPTQHSSDWIGYMSLAIFVFAILLGSFEEFIDLRKS